MLVNRVNENLSGGYNIKDVAMIACVKRIVFLTLAPGAAGGEFRNQVSVRHF
jgi:hypothetical protein